MMSSGVQQRLVGDSAVILPQGRTILYPSAHDSPYITWRTEASQNTRPTQEHPPTRVGIGGKPTWEAIRLSFFLVGWVTCCVVLSDNSSYMVNVLVAESVRQKLFIEMTTTNMWLLSQSPKNDEDEGAFEPDISQYRDVKWRPWVNALAIKFWPTGATKFKDKSQQLIRASHSEMQAEAEEVAKKLQEMFDERHDPQAYDTFRLQKHNAIMAQKAAAKHSQS